MPVATSARPSPILVSKSFTRLDSPSPEIRSATRPNPQNGPGELHLLAGTPLTVSPDKEETDVFLPEDDGSVNGAAAPQTFDELPIEIRSATERWDLAMRLRR
jgi:hypothetical protein